MKIYYVLYKIIIFLILGLRAIISKKIKKFLFIYEVTIQLRRFVKGR